MESAYPSRYNRFGKNTTITEGKPDMLYLGLDVHSKWMTVRGLDPETGEEVQINKLPNDIDSLEQYFSNLQGPLFGAMESGTNSWAVFRILEPHFEKLIVVDPATVWGRDIRRGAKTDRRDAIKLAIKMHRGELEPLYVPDPETQDLRALTRAKINASRHVTKLVNEMGSLLRSWGIIVECSLLSQKGERLIEESKTKLPKYSLTVLDMWLKMLKQAQEAECELEKRVNAEAARDETCQILMSIPDVGPITALVIRSEVGDINRFGSAAALICYCGLSPSVSQSSENIHYGKLKKACNRYLKYVLVLRAQGISRSRQENPMRATYWRVVIKGKNHAKIAVARQLVRVIYHMLNRKERWDASKIVEKRALSESRAA
jgi:transposase